MRSPAIVSLALVLVPATAAAAVVCPDRTPQAITSPPAESVKCQTTVAKAAEKFFKAKLKAAGKCMAQQVPGLCPSAKDIEKAEKAAMKAAEKIAKDCEDDAAQAGLTSSYAALTDPGPIASCMLSQHNATAEILLGVINGTPGEFSTNKDRAKCVKQLNKSGLKYATGALKLANKCLKKQMKAGAAGDLAPVCVGSWAGGSFIAPTDSKTAEKLAKLDAKTEADIANKCTPPGFNWIPTIFACPGATSTADLQTCVVCESRDRVLDLLDQQNNESGAYVANGPGALQAAVDAASPGARLLIGSGDYPEEVTITTHGLQLVGCGGATNDRPRVIPPATVGPHPNGIFAAGIDGLLFQSLDVFDWDENGIFVTGADGVTFRDVVADGNLNSEYGVFPVTSNDVLVEGCVVTRVADAGIYVGQSTNIMVRYNRTELNVAGIEIENSAFATVHNNYTANNTGGLLVFKLPGPPVQLSNDHEVFNNVVVNNNTANFGGPGEVVSLIPDGTGIFILSNDRGDFHHNIVKGNNSFGIALVDQLVINFLVGAPVFDPASPDQKAEDNSIHDNEISGNGLAPDNTPPNATPLSANLLFVLLEDASHGNCIFANSSAPTLLTPNDCS